MTANERSSLVGRALDAVDALELPTISVVIPTYNGECWIVETLESVLTQTLPPDEVIVADDASTDGTVERAQAVARTSPVPVHVVGRETNCGSPASTVNLGVASATGVLVAVLDQDDVFLPRKLEQQARALWADPETSFVFSLFGAHDAGRLRRDEIAALSRVRRIRHRMTLRDGCLRCEGSVALEELGRSGNFVGGFPGFLFRRSAWEERGGFDENLLIAADYEFLCWLCTRGAVGFIPTIHYRTREHGGNLMRQSGIQWRLDLVDVMLRYADSTGTVGGARVMRDSVRHHLLQVARRLASAGHWRNAREVCLAASAIDGGASRRRVYRLSLPAYCAYRRFLKGRWAISAKQAGDAACLAERAVRALRGTPK